ncbi:MAG TPA: beta-phosphoglucomutase [Candidatus Limiplasma sp.]|nr:beta-phosphoglucomutase [Candidatus Limiplasma sp.]HRX08101.1 beta-phosphoglucomutase [Candidatus Limiplasma sp.]
MIRGWIFDLDGVIVDTAKYHFAAWKELADTLGIPFTKQDNERLKGVSRVRSLEIVLEIGGLTLSDDEKTKYATWKNDRYLEFINQLREDEILPGVKAFIMEARKAGYRVGLGSASKNTDLVLEKLKITDLFDAVIDGNKVQKAKPDPEVFLKCAQELNVPAGECVVFEDAEAGVQAAKNAGMLAVGIGSRENLPLADYNMPGFAGVTLEALLAHIQP